MLRGVNDTAEQARALVEPLRRPLYHLNLIAYNAAGGQFERPDREQVEPFRARLEKRRRAAARCGVHRGARSRPPAASWRCAGAKTGSDATA